MNETPSEGKKGDSTLRLRRLMGQEVDRGETGEGMKASFSSQLDCPEGSH